jgi:hypothetical protein
VGQVRAILGVLVLATVMFLPGPATVEAGQTAVRTIPAALTTSHVPTIRSALGRHKPPKHPTQPPSCVSALCQLGIPQGEGPGPCHVPNCPRIELLGPYNSFSGPGTQRLSGPIVRLSSAGAGSISLKCVWHAPCVGAAGLMDGLFNTFQGPAPIATSYIDIPPGQTRLVQLELNKCGPFSCGGLPPNVSDLRAGQTFGTMVQVLLKGPNGNVIIPLGSDVRVRGIGSSGYWYAGLTR